MRLRLGVGGRVGPVRLGISTRGIGGGLGPLSAGVSFRSHRRRHISSGRRGRGSRRSASSSGSSGWAYLLGALLVLALCWLIAAWPWMLGTYVATQNGIRHGTAGWTAAGWIPEGAYLAIVLAIATSVGITKWRARTRPAWRHRAGDPPALNRWWDGRQWTPQVQWDLQRQPALIPPGPQPQLLNPASVPRPAAPAWTPPPANGQALPHMVGDYYTHGGCTIRHRRYDTALRCRQG